MFFTINLYLFKSLLKASVLEQQTTSHQYPHTRTKPTLASKLAKISGTDLSYFFSQFLSIGQTIGITVNPSQWSIRPRNVFV